MGAINLCFQPFFNWESADAVWKYFLLFLAFELGRTTDDLSPVYHGTAWGIALQVPFLLAQMYGWDGIAQTAAPAGLFGNKNHLAEAATLVAIAALALRAYGLFPYIAAAAIIPGSRASLLALAVAAFYRVARWNRRWARVIGILAFVIVGMNAERFAQDNSMRDRAAIWSDTFQGLTWLGNGPGTFRLQYPSHSTHRQVLLDRPDHPHNEYLMLVYEFGIFGAMFMLISGTWLFVCCRRMEARAPEPYILFAGGVLAFFAFPLHLPVTGCLLALAAGHCVAHGPSLRDFFHGRRNRLFPGRKSG